MLTGSTQICKKTRAVKRNENSCPFGENDKESSSSTFLRCSMVSFLKLGILRITHVEHLPHDPACPHKASVLGAARERPHSCLLPKDENTWLGGAGKRRGRRHHPSKTYFFWFPCLLYYWLLAKWSFRSSAYSNRRKLNINNRLFPSRLLFVNKRIQVK